MPAADSTPLRLSHGQRESPGVRRISDSTIDYADGSEGDLLEIIGRAADLASDSIELESYATSWPERYHLSRQRANMLRWLDLSNVDTVLEVGAGCGAITRYLGEQIRVVDAVEPMPARAEVAAARTSDLPSVRVFCGEIDAIPPQDAYDLVVVCGVFEYAAEGSHLAVERQSEFLRKLTTLLRPEGTILIAIENQLGVKYLAGAPEDHSGIQYDSIMNYPTPGAARTYTRAGLKMLCAEAGLSAEIAGAFPDYKLTNSVLTDNAFTEYPDIVRSLPKFPSPDWVGTATRQFEEGALWRTLVDAGLAQEFPNSFIVLASRLTQSPLIPPDLVGWLISNARSPQFATSTLIQRERDGVLSFKKRRLRSDLPPCSGTLTHEARDSSYVAGRDWGDDFLEATNADRSRMLRQWRQQLLDHLEESDAVGLPIDYIPLNMRTAPDGTLVAIDQEWFDSDAEVQFIILRGLAYLSRWVSARGLPISIVRLGELAGVPVTDDDLQRLIHDETRFQRTVSGLANRSTSPDVEERIIANFFGLGRLMPAETPTIVDRVRTAVRTSARRLRGRWVHSNSVANSKRTDAQL